MFSGHEIKKAIRSHRNYLTHGAPHDVPRIVIEPFEEKQLNPNSYNLRLADKLLFYDRMGTPDPSAKDLEGPPELCKWNNVLDMAEDNPICELTIPEEGLVLIPGRVYLGSTVEHTETYNCIPLIEGRSSVGRLGLTSHITAGLGESFFRGSWTLELNTTQPLRIYAGVEICQIAYLPIVGRVMNYDGKYQGQTGPRPSGLWKEFDHGRINATGLEDDEQLG